MPQVKLISPITRQEIRKVRVAAYDDTIVHQMIECVKVYPDGRLDIIFGGGYLIEEGLKKESW